jgi:hypothetical protein
MSTIESIMRELKITWGYDTTELQHIQDLLEEYGAIQYVRGALSRQFQDGETEE